MMLVTARTLSAKTNEGYYRFPALYENTIVFTAEGDLWVVGLEGGLARRLTSHPGIESDASISPDGKTVAFKAQYEGIAELYTMPLVGGLPRRLTFHGISGVTGWTPDGKILYRSYHLSTLPNAQLFVFDPNTENSERLPLAQAADGRYDETGKTLFFTRLPFQGSYTKQYQGGSVEQVWKFTRGASEAEPLTPSYPGTSRSPMWWDNRIYFVSDRDGTMNLWSMNEAGDELSQHTFHKGWDVKSPSLYQGRVVYQLGADLNLLDLATKENRPLSIQLASDFDQLRDKWVKNPLKFLSSMDVSPNGDRLLVTSRGRVFVIPAKKGRLVEVTRQQGVRFKHARFMPDGKTVLIQSDKTGEFEYVTVSADGLSASKHLTDDACSLNNPAIPSPDGKWLVFTDKEDRLSLFDMGRRKKQVIGQSDVARGYTFTPPHSRDVAASPGFFNITWSPDSRWLAYARLADNGYAVIHLYDIYRQKLMAVTSDRVYSFSPSWSPDGKWLYFLSDRHFMSEVKDPWGQRQPEPFFSQTTKVYQLALQKGLQSPFREGDELSPVPEGKRGDKDSPWKDSEGKQGFKFIKVEGDGLAARLYEVPVTAGNYEKLEVTDKCVYLTETGHCKQLVAVDIHKKPIEKTIVMDDFTRYVMSGNKEKILVETTSGLHVINATGERPDKIDTSKVDLSQWTFSVNPREEWRQMLRDAWRMERDNFYDPNFHGADWQLILDRHLPLIDRLTDRDELDDLLAQMVGELHALHTFVTGGDKRQGADHIAIGFLGAELKREPGQGGYRISRIYKGNPDYPEKQSPLQKSEVGINEGDIIEQVDGVLALAVPDISELLKNKAGKQVRLRVKSVGKKRRDVIVVPFSAEQARQLRYDDWELSCRNRVEAVGQGDLGYIHLRAMGSDDIAQWAREYYPVFNRKGLIIDVRHNQGGNIDSWILEKLLRRPWFYWKTRTGKPYWSMQYAFHGHMVVLCNEKTCSNGEAFAEGFRRLGLGKVIGTRTWGGVIWLNFDNWLVDKGIASVPLSAMYDKQGRWLIEGYGVEPDIVVDNLPHATFQGKDAQLEAAIDYLKEKIANEPVGVPEAPAYPLKNDKI
ncbi:S41 family peptidase [Endozoicomonas sp. Mp262]|uniref:S41 family peptidase n=1 Tax=Endozoicomonas sp. Mp262 TaxID=2919499 RepID=UPI0021E00692